MLLTETDFKFYMISWSAYATPKAPCLQSEIDYLWDFASCTFHVPLLLFVLCCRCTSFTVLYAPNGPTASDPANSTCKDEHAHPSCSLQRICIPVWWCQESVVLGHLWIRSSLRQRGSSLRHSHCVATIWAWIEFSFTSSRQMQTADCWASAELRWKLGLRWNSIGTSQYLKYSWPSLPSGMSSNIAQNLAAKGAYHRAIGSFIVTIRRQDKMEYVGIFAGKQTLVKKIDFQSALVWLVPCPVPIVWPVIPLHLSSASNSSGELCPQTLTSQDSDCIPALTNPPSWVCCWANFSQFIHC